VLTNTLPRLILCGLTTLCRLAVTVLSLTLAQPIPSKSNRAHSPAYIAAGASPREACAQGTALQHPHLPAVGPVFLSVSKVPSSSTGGTQPVAQTPSSIQRSFGGADRAQLARRIYKIDETCG